MSHRAVNISAAEKPVPLHSQIAAVCRIARGTMVHGGVENKNRQSRASPNHSMYFRTASPMAKSRFPQGAWGPQVVQTLRLESLVLVLTRLLVSLVLTITPFGHWAFGHSTLGETSVATSAFAVHSLAVCWHVAFAGFVQSGFYTAMFGHDSSHRYKPAG